MSDQHPSDNPSTEPARGDHGKEKDNVIALSRYRARLGRGKRMRRVDALMAQPNPEQAIRALPGDELYYLLREDDPREARDLLAFARPEQIQVVLDFGLWSGDRLLPRRLDEWVDVMAEMPFETVGAWLKGLDTELLALLIRKGARIYDVSIEEPPDEPEGTFYPTPDRLFVLDITGYRSAAEQQEYDDEKDDPEHAAAEEQTASASALLRVIDSLYRADMNFCRRILVAAKAELDSELEELALRWRQGRMADLGFIDAIEALEIYRALDPASVKIGELRPGTRMRPNSYEATGQGQEPPPDLLRAPGILGEHLGGASLFARSLGRVTNTAELEEIHFALVALANRVLAADRVDPADDRAVGAGMARMRGTLDLAIDFLARAGGSTIDEDRAVDAVRTVTPMRLFRLGVSLIGKLRALGHALLKRGPFAGLAHLELMEEPEASVLEAVTQTRPMYEAVLDDPPHAGQRPFESLADIARVTAAIQRAAAAQALLMGLGVRPEHLLPKALEGAEPKDAQAIDTALLARTALVRLVLAQRPGHLVDSAKAQASGNPDRAAGGDPVAFAPLRAADITAFEKRTRTAGARKSGADASVDVLAKARALLERAAPAGLAAATNEMVERWLATLTPLEPVLTRSPKTAEKR